MKTYKKGVDLFLVGNDITVTTKLHIQDADVLYSTKKITGVKLLDRSKFIKSIDLDEIALNHGLTGRYANAFKEGYNANKSEFTIEDMDKCFRAGLHSMMESETKDVLFGEFIISLRPLTLPESITINDNDEIVEVVWNQ